MAEEKKGTEEKKTVEKNVEEKKKNNNGGRGAAAAGVVALLLLLGGGGFFGFGPGHDMLPGNGDTVQQEQSAGEAEAEAQPQETENTQDVKEESSEIPDVIVVRIVQDKVTINGHEVKDKEELKKYVEEYNSDKRTFTLEEEESILGTYNWVKEVFDELDIQLKNSR